MWYPVAKNCKAAGSKRHARGEARIGIDGCIGYSLLSPASVLCRLPGVASTWCLRRVDLVRS